MFHILLFHLIIERRKGVVGLVKKMRNADDYIKHLYVHMNELNQFVIFSGLSFQEFVSSVDQLEHLLLLKPLSTNSEGSFNMHTRLAFIEKHDLLKFSKQVQDKKDDLCWIDFSDDKRINLLTPQEQAELLYIGHKKEPIRSPFYHELQNRFVYLEQKDEKLTKVYARNLVDIYEIVINVFNNLIQMKERAASFWRRRPISLNLQFPQEAYKNFREELQDGALLSIYRVEKPKVDYVLEIRNVSEINFPDEIWDDLNSLLKKKADTILKTNTK